MKNEKLKILIASYFFYPENMPRAFRTFELAKGFSAKGHEVDVYIPDYDFDYNELSKKHNINIYKINSGFFFNKGRKKKIFIKNKINFKKKTIVNNILKKVLYYFFGEIKFEYAIEIYKALKENKKKYDIIISISYPIYVHYGVALAIKNNKDFGKIKIADCGDPFYYQEENKIAFYFKFFEKWIFNKFDYITVPVNIAINSYLYFKNKNNIKVIPQGFDLSNIKLAKYNKNKIPTFGYAGAFIENQRDPKILFEYLLNAEFDYRFSIYLTKSESSLKLINKYTDLLKDKIIIKANIPRDDILFELSKCDFLINIENLSTNQTPSKLIDYSITNRPIFSFHPEKFNKEIFNEFISGNYNSKLNINLKDYNIKKITDDFLELLNNN